MINTRLLDFLQADGLLGTETAQQIAEMARQQCIPVISYLVRKQILRSAELCHYCANKFALTMHELDCTQDPFRNDLFCEDFVYRNRIIAIGYKDDFLYAATSDPTDLKLLERIAFHVEAPVYLLLVDEEQLEQYLQTQYPSDILTRKLNSALAQLPSLARETLVTVDEHDEPVSQFVAGLLNEASHKHVSDIHIEPREASCVVRFRCDGLLTQAAVIPAHLAARVCTRLKIMANLNIAERRLPQDGRMRQNDIDIRVSSCPTLHGEKLVLRLLDSSSMQRDLTQLGLDAEQLQQFHVALAKPQGMIIVTGPTGSGKTVTLYSALVALNQVEKNIVTIEDPVEIRLPGINQIHVNAEIGLNFAAILHSILRQDPDVIMVGEIRDYETALIALQAAQTGHLVLTTLHANSAGETLQRLRTMGVGEQYLTSSIILVAAQRLLRKLCACKQQEGEFYNASGCNDCSQGYKGRTGVFECMDSGAYKNLWQAGLAKAREGVTSYAELVRVLGIRPC